MKIFLKKRTQYSKILLLIVVCILCFSCSHSQREIFYIPDINTYMSVVEYNNDKDKQHARYVILSDSLDPSTDKNADFVRIPKQINGLFIFDLTDKKKVYTRQIGPVLGETYREFYRTEEFPDSIFYDYIKTKGAGTKMNYIKKPYILVVVAELFPEVDIYRPGLFDKVEVIEPLNLQNEFER